MLFAQTLRDFEGTIHTGVNATLSQFTPALRLKYMVERTNSIP